MRILILPLLACSLSGCLVSKVAETAVDVATIPVKVAGEAVDAVTVSQAEADQKRGKELRKAEERHAKAMREWSDECAKLEARGRECPPRPVFVVPD
ncbi:hypothetical protein [Sphingomicrobium clamense]|uniref:Lipoprotein n=1 Tax=Sphingomicrobium clamense TaxID=2851013 RepID=A0ABS6V8I7_9SPHN|nr:hypothetical protein [Sphingomicrobium sp. B8]MBW0145839.1 hypothetical protein [Sphingomicrobium sp. B8]